MFALQLQLPVSILPRRRRRRLHSIRGPLQNSVPQMLFLSLYPLFFLWGEEEGRSVPAGRLPPSAFSRRRKLNKNSGRANPHARESGLDRRDESFATPFLHSFFVRLSVGLTRLKRWWKKASSATLIWYRMRPRLRKCMPVLQGRS